MAGVLLSVLLLGTSASATVKTEIPAKVRTDLLNEAERRGLAYGDPHPNDIEAVFTTKRKALPVITPLLEAGQLLRRSSK